jgi:uroporphyrinogen-III decarboxylase
MTKLLADPITPVFLAGSGLTAEEEPDVGLVESVLDLATEVVLHSVGVQLAAGARAIFIAEPAANKVYISPNQLAEGSDIFTRMPIRANRRIKELLDRHGVELIFHCCGELVDSMVDDFCSLRPAMLSLGCSRAMWDDAARVPKDIVLYGNLPSKRFYSDELISVDGVVAMARDLRDRMKDTGHPFILGSECDILSVPGCERQLMSKAMAIAQFE